MPRAIEVTADRVRTAVHELCRPVKKVAKTALQAGVKESATVDVTLLKDIALLYLSDVKGQWGRLKRFNGITTAPILSDDGSLRVADEYDPESGLWCHNVPRIDIPPRPTKSDAQAALARLRHYFRTFPFADGDRVGDSGASVVDIAKPPGMDESIFLAALMTAVARQSLETAPAVVCDAPNISGAGTGKGLLIKSIAIIGSGARPAAFTSGHDKQELDKRLTAALIEAKPAIFLDNFNAKDLHGDLLSSALTESKATVRPMGKTATVPLHTRTLVCITVNGITIAEDIARRFLKIRLDAKMENPEQRKFKPGFLEGVHKARVKLLSDALIIWRWGRQSDLDPGRSLGSYEQWAQWCRDPLLALGCRDPVERIDEIKAADPQRAALLNFFKLWWEMQADLLTKASDIDDALKEIADERAIRKSDGTLQFNRQRVAKFLSVHAGTCIGGFTFRRIRDTLKTRPTYLYKLICFHAGHAGYPPRVE